MRPSNPGAAPGYPGHPAHPHPLYGAQVFPSRGPQKPTNNLKYYPSLSGSETDVSTSTENLTQEERFVLRNMERQEPQGEETAAAGPHYQYQPPPPYHERIVAQQIASNHARREALRLDAVLAASRHATPAQLPAPGPRPVLDADLYAAMRMSQLSQSAAAGSRLAAGVPVSAGSATAAAASGSLYPSPSPGPPPASAAAMTQEHSLSRLAPSVYSHPSVQDPILKSPKSFYQDPQVIVPNRGFNISSSGAYFDTSAISRPPVTSSQDLQSQNDLIAKLTREMKMNGGLSGGSDVESSGSTSTLNNPSATAEKIAALALQAKLSDSHNVTNGAGGFANTSQPLDTSQLLESHQTEPPPPPPYESPKKDDSKGVKAQEVRKASLGKPDNLPLLSSLSTQPGLPSQTRAASVASAASVPGTSAQEAAAAAAPSLGSPDAPHYTQEMMEIIIGENRELKHSLDLSKRRIMKLDNLEKEMMKIHEAYSALKEHSEKRELLEKSARSKLQAEVLNLTEENKQLKDRHDAIMNQMMSADSSNIPGLDTILRGEIMRKDGLISQLVGQNKELMAAKDRQDIELTAQRETIQEHRTHIDVLDSALSNAQTNVLRLEEVKREMTKKLEQLQAAGEKREVMEKKLRGKLEEEVKELRQGKELIHSLNDNEDFEKLRLKLSDYEEKIIRLESDRSQWEQRYIEEAALRQVALDAASKVTVLEKSSAESEKKVAEARSDKLRQSAELQHTARRVADMETQIRVLRSELQDRDSIITILQTRAQEPGPGHTSDNVLSIPIQDSSSLLLHPAQPPASVSMVSAAADFFEGISRDMSSTSRGPIQSKVKSSSPAPVAAARSGTPSASELLRGGVAGVSSPTRELIKASSSRRDSAPTTLLSDGVSGKTLIATHELYSSNGQSHTSGTLPKMSFAPMKEELSRTLPSKGFPSMPGQHSAVSPGGRRGAGGGAASSPVRQLQARAASRSRDRGDQSNMSLDSSMTLLDNTVNSAAGSGVWSRSSMDRSTLLEALKQERETRPESFWRV